MSLTCIASRAATSSIRELWGNPSRNVLTFSRVPGASPPAALAIHSAGVLGKLYSETLEAIPSRPVEALAATGASDFQAFHFGRLPQAMSGFTSLTLYQWECSIRWATILSFVGAGGLGQEILISMNLFDYPKVATLVGATKSWCCSLTVSRPRSVAVWHTSFRMNDTGYHELASGALGASRSASPESRSVEHPPELQFVSYLSPGIPRAFFEAVVEHVRRALGQQRSARWRRRDLGRGSRFLFTLRRA